MKILVIAPHPDDEIIGCGGYLTKLKNQGEEIEVIYITIPSNKRGKEIQKVKRLMQFKEVFLINEQERNINKHDLLIKLIKIIRNTKPDMLIIPHLKESDSDHKLVSEVSLEATFFSSGLYNLKKNETTWNIPIVLGYEVWSPIQNPQLHINISDQFYKKLKAMNLYNSQIDKEGTLLKKIQGLNKYRASNTLGSEYAESYTIYKMVEKNIGY